MSKSWLASVKPAPNVLKDAITLSLFSASFVSFFRGLVVKNANALVLERPILPRI